jgi:phosphatidylglycerol:prolipoprotein diacylglycerol transferase
VFHYPEFHPVAFSIGPLQVRWYGIMYLCAFLLVWIGLRMRAKQPWSKVKPQNVDDVVFYGALGAIVGGRIGYMFIYAHQELFADPLSIFTVWKGGMSFHGGLSGVLIAMWLYGRRTGVKFFDLTDAIAPWCAGGIFFGRIGNFINGELWGKVTSPDAPWAVLVNGEPRHASQLYEAFLEGLVLSFVLWFYTRKPRPTAAASGLFLILYGAFRILIEFVRVPDEQLGYLTFGWVTMGQILSLPMVIIGAVMLVLALRAGLDGDGVPSAGTPRAAGGTMQKKAG